MFILKSIIDKYINNNNNKKKDKQDKLNKIFVGFVDFRKAFDSIWRKGLYYKLLKNNINGNIYYLIKNMYEDINYRIKLNNGITSNFKSLRGVRQGCNISPILFNLFLNDLPNKLDESCKPVKLDVESLNSLLYADDLVLMSETEEGLQNCFNKLSGYCNSWNLEVNTAKTKVIIFNKNGRLLNQKYSFRYRDEEIDIVRNYKYLGIVFKPSGKFDLAKEQLYKKAMKAFFYIKKVINSYTNISITTWINIFDHVIRPILTYGCEIWGIEKYTDKTYIEKLNLKLCKMLLQVNQSATNLAVRGELGRYPLSIFIQKMMFRYWHRNSTKKENSLVYDAVLCNIDTQSPWAKLMQDISDEVVIRNYWDGNRNGIHEISNKIELDYVTKWKKEIKADRSRSGQNNKLRTYSTFKKEFKMEEYLINVKEKNCRKYICKYIEKGRHIRPKIDVEERKCNKCDTDTVEDEFHYIITCPHYKEIRKKLFDSIDQRNQQFNSLSNEDKFAYIMSNASTHIDLGVYIKESGIF